MKRKLNFLVLIICFCSSISFGQEKERDLKDQRITIKMDKQPLGVVFRELMVKYDVPIGFEESALDRDHNDFNFETNIPYDIQREYQSADKSLRVTVTKENLFTPKMHWISINIKNGKLSNVLDAVVLQMDNYKWEINDEVINIYPIKGRDERYRRILETTVQNFALSQSQPKLWLIRNKIIELPEWRSFLSENNLYCSFYRESLDNLTRKLSGDINLSNLTFRELLNKITKVKRGGWILKQSDVFGTKEKE
jgi:hypothetical protein